jgi:hypothetical protein
MIYFAHCKTHFGTDYEKACMIFLRNNFNEPICDPNRDMDESSEMSEFIEKAKSASAVVFTESEPGFISRGVYSEIFANGTAWLIRKKGVMFEKIPLMRCRINPVKKNWRQYAAIKVVG